MRKAIVLVAVLALFGAPSLFGADLSVGADVPVGLTYWKLSTDSESTNGLLIGGNAVLNVMFTPQMGVEAKVGVAMDIWSDDDLVWDFKDTYLNVVGLFKYYVNPSVYVGAGLELNYFLKMNIEDSFGTEVDIKRSDLTDTENYDPLFLLVTGGYEFVASPAVVVPLGVNIAYGVLNIPDDVTRMHIYASIGVRYLL